MTSLAARVRARVRRAGVALARPASKSGRTSHTRDRERGQGLAELTMVLPALLLVLTSAAEFGLLFDDMLTVGYGSREGARVGAALAKGEPGLCTGGGDPSRVDNAVIGAVQRIIKSPGSGAKVEDVTEIRIFKATSTGAQSAGLANVWRYTGDQSGPEADASGLHLDFSPVSLGWQACDRVNGGSTPDSLGVSVVYLYHLATPLGGILALMGGSQAATVSLTETTIMALNPTV